MSFIGLIKKWRNTNNLRSLIENIINDISYRNMLLEEYPDSPKTVEYKMTGIRILSERINRYLERNPDATLSDYINVTALVNEDDEDDDNKVSLMTMHASKGLEFDIVYIAGMEDDIIPSKRSLEEDLDNIYEERRLFYVAITRARRELIINYALKRINSMGEVKTALPSRFLEEIPQDLQQNKQLMLEENRKNSINELKNFLKRISK